LQPVLKSPEAAVRDLAVSSPTLPREPEVEVFSTVTDGEWTLIDGGAAAASELYHLPSDPGQANNVFGERRDVADRLHERYLSLLAEIGTAAEKLYLRRW
jgi:hypothetical protein